MSQGKLNGLASNLGNYNQASQPGPNLSQQIQMQGIAPVSNHGILGQQPGAFGAVTPAQPQPAQPSLTTTQPTMSGQQQAWANLQGLVQQGNKQFGQGGAGLPNVSGIPSAPIAPSDSSLAQGPGPNYVAPGPVPPTNPDGLNTLPAPDNYITGSNLTGQGYL
jgi:hypothetical protein